MSCRAFLSIGRASSQIDQSFHLRLTNPALCVECRYEVVVLVSPTADIWNSHTAASVREGHPGSVNLKLRAAYLCAEKDGVGEDVAFMKILVADGHAQFMAASSAYDFAYDVARDLAASKGQSISPPTESERTKASAGRPSAKVAPDR